MKQKKKQPEPRITVPVEGGGTMDLTPHELEFIKAYREKEKNDLLTKNAVEIILGVESKTVKFTDTGTRIQLIHKA